MRWVVISTSDPEMAGPETCRGCLDERRVSTDVDYKVKVKRIDVCIDAN